MPLQTVEDVDQEAPLNEEDLLLEMVRSVVRRPEKVAIAATHGRDTTVLTITVDQDDIRHVFGREHRTIQALTHLIAKSAAMRNRRTIVNLDIDPELKD